MTCREFVALIRARLDNELDLNEVIRFDQHASVCTECAAYMDGYRQTISATKRAFNSPDLSAEDSDLTEDLVEQIINYKRRVPMRRTSEH
jgi:anti-sigma factor RsiW